MKKIIAIALAVLLAIPLGIVFTTAEETNIAAGKTYTRTGVHKDANNVISYPDTDNKELTDGAVGTADSAYDDAVWSGFNWKGEGADCADTTWTDTTVAKNNIIIDLGKTESNLTKFVVYVDDTVYGIGKLKGAEVFISNNGTDYTSVGTAAETKLLDATAGAQYGIYTYTVSLSASVSARYVKFVITHGQAWAFLSEVEVYQDANSTPVTPVPVETHSLISLDPAKWLSGAPVGTNNEVATASKVGDAIVISGSTASWPYAYYNIESPVTVTQADFNLVYDFTVTGGKANIILFCEGSTVEDNKNYVADLTHIIVPDGGEGRPVGTDDLADGTYTGSINLADLNYQNVTLLETGKIQISGFKVYSVAGGVVTINKFAIESVATKLPDVSNTASTTSTVSNAASSAASSKAASSAGTVKPGDSGIIALALIAVVALIGTTTLAAKKRVK